MKKTSGAQNVSPVAEKRATKKRSGDPTVTSLRAPSKKSTKTAPTAKSRARESRRAAPKREEHTRGKGSGKGMKPTTARTSPPARAPSKKPSKRTSAKASVKKIEETEVLQKAKKIAKSPRRSAATEKLASIGGKRETKSPGRVAKEPKRERSAKRREKVPAAKKSMPAAEKESRRPGKKKVAGEKKREATRKKRAVSAKRRTKRPTREGEEERVRPRVEQTPEEPLELSAEIVPEEPESKGVALVEETITAPPRHAHIEMLSPEYGENSITLLPVNPFRIFAFWEVRRETLKIFKGALTLRLYDITDIDFDAREAQSFRDIAIYERIGKTYLDVLPSRRYVGDIGILYEGIFIGFARSAPVSTPVAHVPGEEVFSPAHDADIPIGY